ncbi:hypothetical protein [Bordetella bronchiseptica]|uniref:hypothetical protein n=1 Tax=Bordetella bronchiseptica TaxID=518 RepID=UPI000529008C|nr:hypothetical protein [Bordetella bronchiseptica]VTQ77732.1 Uncharacterised protein [Bordetella bronchiseptica]
MALPYSVAMSHDALDASEILRSDNDRILASLRQTTRSIVQLSPVDLVARQQRRPVIMATEMISQRLSADESAYRRPATHRHAAEVNSVSFAVIPGRLVMCHSHLLWFRERSYPTSTGMSA